MMRTRFLTLFVAIAAIALAPAALADHHGGKGKGHERALERSSKKMDGARERAEEAREDTERRREAAQGKSDKSRGDEMRARRDERKAIMDEAKDAAEPGTPRRGKKPWWRFWEADEPE